MEGRPPERWKRNRIYHPGLHGTTALAYQQVSLHLCVRFRLWKMGLSPRTPVVRASFNTHWLPLPFPTRAVYSVRTAASGPQPRQPRRPVIHVRSTTGAKSPARAAEADSFPRRLIY